MKVFDFKCPDGHVEEHFVKDVHDRHLCSCGLIGVRQISSPAFKLEGITGHFPGAASKWERNRAEKQAVEEQKLRDHGDSGWTY